MRLPEGSLLKPLLAQRLGEVNKAKGKRSLGQLQGKIGEMPMARGLSRGVGGPIQGVGQAGCDRRIERRLPLRQFISKSHSL